MAEPTGETAVSASGDAGAPPSSTECAWRIGDEVLLARPLRYLKTADPMPMLRPPDLVEAEEVGVIRELRPAGCLAVRFRRGTFLIAASDLRPVQSPVR